MNEFNERDLFAALAMCGLVAHRGFGSDVEQYADGAYRIAEAMLAEKAKRDDRQEG
jgi:hypothetical protein